MPNLIDLCAECNPEPVRVHIHGPTWTNTMPLDAHAMTVIIPYLTSNGWQMHADKRFNRIDLISPFVEAMP